MAYSCNSLTHSLYNQPEPRHAKPCGAFKCTPREASSILRCVPPESRDTAARRHTQAHTSRLASIWHQSLWRQLRCVERRSSPATSQVLKAKRSWSEVERSRAKSRRVESSRVEWSRVESSRVESSLSSRLVTSRLISSRLVSSRLVSSRLVSSRHVSSLSRQLYSEPLGGNALFNCSRSICARPEL